MTMALVVDTTQMSVCLLPGGDPERVEPFSLGSVNPRIPTGLFVTKVPGARYTKLDASFAWFVNELQKNFPNPSQLFVGGEGWAERYELSFVVNKNATIFFYADGQHFASIEALQIAPSTMKLAGVVDRAAHDALKYGFWNIITKIAVSPFLDELPAEQPAEQPPAQTVERVTTYTHRTPTPDDLIERLPGVRGDEAWKKALFDWYYEYTRIYKFSLQDLANLVNYSLSHIKSLKSLYDSEYKGNSTK